MTSANDIAAAADALTRGELVAFPTETVYGLGADATDDRAVALVFAILERDAEVAARLPNRDREIAFHRDSRTNAGGDARDRRVLDAAALREAGVIVPEELGADRAAMLVLEGVSGPERWLEVPALHRPLPAAAARNDVGGVLVEGAESDKENPHPQDRGARAGEGLAGHVEHVGESRGDVCASRRLLDGGGRCRGLGLLRG